MSNETHIDMTNGFTRGALVDDVRPYEDQIRYTLSRLGGLILSSYALWRAPEGADLLEKIPFSENYLQAAGTAEAMTIEIRFLDADGEPHQYTLGKPGTKPDGPRTATVSWAEGQHSTQAQPSELFTAQEAGDIFCEYYRTDTVPATLTLREHA